MKSPQSLLLASTAILAIIAAQPQVHAASAVNPIILAQLAPADVAKQFDDKAKADAAAKVKAEADAKVKAEAGAKAKADEATKAKQAEEKAKPPAAAERPARPERSAAPAKPEAKPDTKPAAAAPEKPATPPAAATQQRAAPPVPPSARDARQDRREDRKDGRQDARQDRREDKQDARQERREDKQQTREERRDDKQDVRKEAAPTTAPAAPTTAAPATAPAARTAAPDKAATEDAKSAVAPPPATQPRDSRAFIRRDGDQQRRGLDDIRSERRETREGNRVFIREGDRTIVREGDRTIIRHNESDRFAIGARNVDVQRRGNEITTVVVRPNGIRIVTVTDRDGNLIRRVRRDANGRNVVIIDNSFRPQRGSFIVDIRAPRVRDRGRYIIDAGRVPPAQLYDVFVAPPIEQLDRRYTLAEVRYNEPLRQYMPRVDLDINFETGSWQLTPDQVDRLAEIAAGLKRVIERRPGEVFLIEGHTDAVGSDEDNLSLSDRRAESVAVALTEQFDVPPENLVTQGYGEEYLKVETEGPSRENRRVAVRRITPLLAQQENTGRK